MTRGDCERAVAIAAAGDGIQLISVGRGIPWLTQRGHLDLPEELTETRDRLARIFEALGGDPVAQSSKKSVPLPGDLIHLPTNTLVEVDEYQHFTSFRRTSLDFYPPDSPAGFDLSRYRMLCDEWSNAADRYRRTKSAPGFGAAGRQRQRAYHDALRDLASEPMGYKLVRVDAVEGDGELAYRRSRERLRAIVG